MSEERFLQQVKQKLDESAQNLDAATQARLTQARHAALESLQKPRASWWKLHWLPASGVALASVMVLSVSLYFLSPAPQAPLQSNSVEDLDIMAAQENFELYEQLDFYQWLLDENVNAS